MQPLRIIRFALWFGLVVAGWSLNIRWGLDPNVGTGPPSIWQRHVVGTALLCLVAAISLSVSGKGDKPPAWIARGIALAAAAGAGILAYSIRTLAEAQGTVANLLGSGWKWLLAGTGIVLGATVAAAVMRQGAPAKGAGEKRTSATASAGSSNRKPKPRSGKKKRR